MDLRHPRLKSEAVLLHDGVALRTGDEGGESAGGLFLLRGLNDREALIEWLVQVFRNQRPATMTLRAQRQRHDRNVNVPGLRILKRLTNVVAVDQLRFHCLPDAGTLESLARGESVRCVIRIRNRDAHHLRPREILDAFETEVAVGGCPQRDATARVDGFAVGNDQALLVQLVDVAHAGGGEEIHWRAVLDLLGEQTSGAEYEYDFSFISGFEGAPELFESGREIGGGGYS